MICQDVENKYLPSHQGFNEINQATLNLLFPNTSYLCHIETNYKGYQIKSPKVIFNTTELKFSFELEPHVEGITLQFDNVTFGLEFDIRLKDKNETLIRCQSFRQSNLTLDMENLDMETNYTVCLTFENSSPVCKTTTTLVGKPYPPTNLKVIEDNGKLQIDWDAPSRSSGNFRYILSIETCKCKEIDQLATCQPDCEKIIRKFITDETHGEFSVNKNQKLDKISVSTFKKKQTSDPIEISKPDQIKVPTFSIVSTTDTITELLIKKTTSFVWCENYSISITSYPKEYDVNCNSKNLSRFETASSKPFVWETRKIINQLKPFHIHTIKVQVVMNDEAGPWSEPLRIETLPITDTEISKFISTFTTSGLLKSIMLSLDPICPYPGKLYENLYDD